MQFPTIFLIAATIATAATAPTGGSSSHGSPAKVQHSGGKWKPGWGGAADGDKYICYTSGLIVSTPSSVFEALKLMDMYLEHPELR